MRRWILIGLASLVTAGCPPSKLPDLVVTQDKPATWTCSASKQLNMNLFPKIQNKGNANAFLSDDWTKNGWITAYADPAVKLPPYIRPVQTCTAGAPCPLTLKPQGSVTVPLSISLPPKPDGGAYNVIVQVDPGNAVAESDENNNTDTIAVPANVCP